MSLRFVGVDPDTPNTGSPTVWVDEGDESIVVQGWKVDEVTRAEVLKTGPIPDHETVIRIPRRMAPFLLEACGDDGTGIVRAVSLRPAQRDAPGNA